MPFPSCQPTLHSPAYSPPSVHTRRPKPEREPTVVRVDRWRSVAIGGTRWQSKAIQGNQRQSSEAILRSHPQK
ncbi:MAG: hypothetical protein ACK56I_14380, partial [bacterium]